jgi:hypothetical protein
MNSCCCYPNHRVLCGVVCCAGKVYDGSTKFKFTVGNEEVGAWGSNHIHHVQQRGQLSVYAPGFRCAAGTPVQLTAQPLLWHSVVGHR